MVIIMMESHSVISYHTYRQGDILITETLHCRSFANEPSGLHFKGTRHSTADSSKDFLK